MKDDLGGLPSRTVLSEGSLTPLPSPLFLSVGSAAGQEVPGFPRRVDARANERDDCSTCRKSKCASQTIGTA
jgi:hypothetical protein